jgi:hypothetical protein
MIKSSGKTVKLKSFQSCEKCEKVPDSSISLTLSENFCNLLNCCRKQRAFRVGSERVTVFDFSDDAVKINFAVG